jgi:DNA-binding IclR family transcriptional regulator
MARPLMQALADETGLAVAMGVRDGNQMIYTANCRSEHPVTLRLNVGSRLPIWRTAMGLAYLAGMIPEMRDAVVAGQIADEPHREADIRRLVDTSLAAYERHGFVSSCGDWHSFINAVGVPFRPTDGSQLVAITCGGIKDIAPPESLTNTLGPKLRVLVEELQNRLTGRDQTASTTP